MGMFYTPSFDLADPAAALGSVTMTLQILPGAPVTVNVAALRGVDERGAPVGVVNHAIGHGTGPSYRGTSVLGAYASAPLATVLQTAMRAAAAAAGWPSSGNSLSVVFNSSTTPQRYEFSFEQRISSLRFSNTQARALFGFAADSTPNDFITYGTVTPSYILVPTLEGVSNATPDYEPDSIACAAMGGTGEVFGMARYTGPMQRDWDQQWEPLEKTYRKYAQPAAPYTYQHLYEQCRGGFPFAVVNGGFSYPATIEAFSLRATHFAPRRAAPGMHAFHVPFATYVAGV